MIGRWAVLNTECSMLRQKSCCLIFAIILVLGACAQADNEIQVYASPTIQKNWTIFELHTNYTFKGSKYLIDQRSAKWFNTTLEITHGFGKKFWDWVLHVCGNSPWWRIPVLRKPVAAKSDSTGKMEMAFWCQLISWVWVLPSWRIKRFWMAGRIKTDHW